MVLLAAAVMIQARPMLMVELKPERPTIKVGQALRFQVLARCFGTQEVLVVPMLDGMDCGLRGPKLELEYRVMGTTDWKRPSRTPRCGNTNPMSADAFRPLRPRESMDLLRGMSWGEPSLAKPDWSPGIYEFRVTYDTTVPFETWIGGPLPTPDRDAAMERLRPLYDRVPKGQFVSPATNVRILKNLSTR